MKPHILFVDDEPRILEGLRRSLHHQRREWDLSFAASGAEALWLMEETSCSIVVTDMRMPEMDGAELLEQVAEKHPHTIRIVLSGYSERQASLRAAGTTHLYLSKPCDPHILKAEIARALRLEQQLSNEYLRRVISKIGSLPSLPQLYIDICHVARSERAGLDEVADLVGRDVGLAAKLLQLVNSSFFRLSREVASIRQAVALLGLETLKSLVLTEGIFRCLTPSATFPGFEFSRLYDHSLACGRLAERIALKETGNKAIAEHALSAGLLHDLGKLILATELPDHFAGTLAVARESAASLYDVEMESDGYSHAQIGAYLLGLWRLPLPVIEAVVYHHTPAQAGAGNFTPATAVYLANLLVQSAQPGSSGNHASSPIDLDYLTDAGLRARLSTWRQTPLASSAASPGW